LTEKEEACISGGWMVSSFEPAAVLVKNHTYIRNIDVGYMFKNT